MRYRPAISYSSFSSHRTSAAATAHASPEAVRIAAVAVPGASQRSAEKQTRQRHHQHLVRNAVDLLEWGKDRHPHRGNSVRSCDFSGSLEAPVEPVYEIAAGDIANEQVQGKGGLIGPAIAQPILRQRALRQVRGLGAATVPCCIGSRGSASSS
jgi:hypothetical protein